MLGSERLTPPERAAVGGAEGGGSDLSVLAPALPALELPGCEASDVDVEFVQSGVVTIAGELNLELQLILLDGLAAHRAGRTDPRPAPGTVRSGRHDGSFPVRTASRAWEQSNASKEKA
jgi:hypothetical protein